MSRIVEFVADDGVIARRYQQLDPDDLALLMSAMRDLLPNASPAVQDYVLEVLLSTEQTARECLSLALEAFRPGQPDLGPEFVPGCRGPARGAGHVRSRAGRDNRPGRGRLASWQS